jgi:hypothetical protein
VLLLLTLLFQEWKDLGPLLQYGPTVVIFGLSLIFLLRVMPMWVNAWKEVKLKTVEATISDANARVAQSKALESVSKVLYEVAVEQRRAADSVKILQRVNSRSIDDFENFFQDSMTEYEKRITRLEANATHTPAENAAAAH